MSKPKITFLMLAYNSEKYLEKAIDSILNQTESDINLIVRNNGSTDSTGEILRKKAAVDPRVHFVENRLNWKYEDGTSFTKDGIIRIWPVQDTALLGEYISIIDSDDWLEPIFAEKMYKAANAIDADIAVCGNIFMKDGIQNCGERLPPEITTGDLHSASELISRNYVQLHNAFRTWWAKLFRTEFFLRNYDEAWQTLGGPYGGVLDTPIMLRYLCLARSLACIPYALYNFRIYSESTYVNRPPHYNRVLEAEEIYAAGLQFLDTFKAHCQANDAFLLRLHWAYILESLPCLNTAHKGYTARRELSWLSTILGNPVLSRFYSNNGLTFFATAIKFTQIVFDRNKEDYTLYSSYLCRLLYLVRQLDSASRSLLLYPILMGCLYDRENKNKLGLQLINNVTICPNFIEFFPGTVSFQKHEIRTSSAYFDFYPSGIAELIDTTSLEDQLELAANDGDYAAVCDLIEKISAIDPFNRNAMFYRIQMAQIAGMRELCAVLAGTALSLWPVDAKMQLLCWKVLQNTADREV